VPELVGSARGRPFEDEDVREFRRVQRFRDGR
jgi:hypothetical protein